MSSDDFQRLPHTYRDLKVSWDSKAGSRSSNEPIFTAASCSSHKPRDRVAMLMAKKFQELPGANPKPNTGCTYTYTGETMAETFAQVSNKVIVRQDLDQTAEGGGGGGGEGPRVWIYNMRDDGLPKSQQDLALLHAFLQTAILFWFDSAQAQYLLQYRTVTTCFFIWHFNQPNFFYRDKIYKVSTRHGKQRVWTPLLIAKKPPSATSATSATPAMPSPPAPTPAPTPPISKPTTTTNAILHKERNKQENLRSDITQLVDAASSNPKRPIEWDDPVRLHLHISEVILDVLNALSNSQRKKLEKTYQEYTTLTAKIERTMAKIHRVKRANDRLAPCGARANKHKSQTQTQTQTSAEELQDKVEDEQPKAGQPKAGQPKAGQPKADQPRTGKQKRRRPIDCPACATNQPNQEAHQGFCLPFFDGIDSDTDEEDAGDAIDDGDANDDERNADADADAGVPDSWEDLCE